jgi:hypothetical protein
MPSITIHDLDKTVAALIRAQARAEKTSLNKIIKRLLEEALGIRASKGKNRKDFEALSGTWSKAQKRSFDKRLEEVSQVDPGDWR